MAENVSNLMPKPSDEVIISNESESENENKKESEITSLEDKTENIIVNNDEGESLDIIEESPEILQEQEHEQKEQKEMSITTDIITDITYQEEEEEEDINYNDDDYNNNYNDEYNDDNEDDDDDDDDTPKISQKEYDESVSFWKNIPNYILTQDRIMKDVKTPDVYKKYY